MSKHVHKMIRGKRVTRGYRGPVGDRQNPVAHGGVCYHDVCRCGATRETNANRGCVERGAWVDAAERPEGGE